jgi:DNA-binding winged helix-turn-helix (wHTH) protein/TolB-like protein/Tfp pilus assembly protein PilF
MPNAVRHFYEFGQFRLDADKHRLLRDGEVVQLSPKAIDILLLLVQNPDKPLEREALLQAVWADTFVEDANLTVAVSHLRRALGQNGEPGEYIETVPRVGYRFVADVREVREAPAPLVIEKRTLSRTVIEEELIHDEPHAEAKTAAIVVQPAIAKRRPAFARRPVTALLLAATALSALALGAILYSKGVRTPTTPYPAAIMSIRSIAVLPPRDLSGAADNASLSLGIADALITRLGGIRKVVVRPTSAIVRYVDSNQDAVNAGRALGVDAVIDGTLQRDGDRMRVTLRLLNVANGAQLWSENFDEGTPDIFKLQDSISQQVGETLFTNLTQDEKVLLTKQQTANPEAYALYLKGNYFWKKRGVEVEKSFEYFRKAIELDPNFAEAYVELAAAVSVRVRPSPEAESLIEKALQLDNTSAEAHATYGFIRMFDHFDWVTAERELDRAIELNPNSVTAHHWKGVYLSLRGRLDEAKAEMHRALDLDPQSLIVTADIGQLHYFAHEYDQAIDYCNRALAMDNSFVVAHIYLRDIYQMKGMDQEFFAEFLRTTGSPHRAKAQSNFAQAGRRGLLMAEMKSPENQRRPWHIVWLSASFGDRNECLEYLDRLFKERGSGEFLLPFINVDPLYDFLRDDPRFKEILHRMNLP